jgi:hypothetical protein
MDEVLTRKMFKARYFKSLKPTIKHFKEGGLGSLTNQEKAIYAATLAAPLLRGKGKGLSSTLASLGEGLEKLPATILSVEKQKSTGPKKYLRQATSAEKRQYGFSEEDNINVTVEQGVVTGIASKPTAGERDKAADRMTAFQSLEDIEVLLEKVDTGPVSGRIANAQAFLGMNKDAALLNVKVKEFNKSIIKALRGAQVGPAEEASFDVVLPSLNDPEDVIKAKIKVAKEKLAGIEERLNPNGTITRQLEAEEIVERDRALFNKFGLAFNLDPNFDPRLPTFTLDGTAKE